MEPRRLGSPKLASPATIFILSSFPGGRFVDFGWCFFFGADRNEERNQKQVRSKRVTKKKESLPPLHREWQMAVITDHLRGGWGEAVGAQPSPALQQRKTKSFRSTARQKSPPLPPRLTSSRTQMPRLSSGLCFGQLVEEINTRLQPTACNFTREDNKSGATELTSELRIDSFYPAASGIQCSSVYLKTDTAVVSTAN